MTEESVSGGHAFIRGIGRTDIDYLTRLRVQVNAFAASSLAPACRRPALRSRHDRGELPLP
jgi:hypothetical protein